MCGKIRPQPLDKGKVLRVRSVSLHGGRLRITVEAISSYESGWVALADLRFVIGSQVDADAVAALEKWVKVFDSQDDAAKFGDTIRGARSK